MVQKITYKGLRNLDSLDINKIQTLVNKNFLKVQRFFSNAALTVDIKKASATGKRARYTIILRVSAPTKTIVNGEHTDWDLQRTVHKAFDNIFNSAKHKYKSDATKRNAKKVLKV